MNIFSSLLLTQTTAQEGAPTDFVYTEHSGSYWFPEQASTFARDVDWLFMLIFWVSLAFFAGIVGAMVYFVLKYRHRPGHNAEKSPSHNTALEIAWSVLPGFLLIWFFVDGAKGFFHQKTVPGDCEEIQVVARQFNWMFYYPDGDSSDKLHVVVNRPVKLVLESEDVLHSFFIPEFRQKQDIVPGRYTYTWFKPIKTGRYRIYCSEYCGNDHSRMLSDVTVHETVESRKAATQWMWNEKPALENGQRLFSMQCSGCHAITAEKKTGPGFAGIWGKQETMDNGQQILVDDNYFRESILEPAKNVVAGFSRPTQMPSFQGKLSDEQIRWLRVYVKSLSNVAEETAAPQTPEGQAPADGATPPPVPDNPDAGGDAKADGAAAADAAPAEGDAPGDKKDGDGGGGLRN